MLLNELQDASSVSLNSWALSFRTFERFPNVIEQRYTVVGHVCVYAILCSHFVQFIFSNSCVPPQADKIAIVFYEARDAHNHVCLIFAIHSTILGKLSIEKGSLFHPSFV